MTDDLNEQDRTALRDCMAIAQHELGLAEQIQSMLDEPRPWAEVAQFACHCVQSCALQLRLRESPPCSPGDKAAKKLRRLVVEAGLSAFHPDPVRALLEAIEAKKKQRKAQRRKSKTYPG